MTELQLINYNGNYFKFKQSTHNKMDMNFLNKRYTSSNIPNSIVNSRSRSSRVINPHQYTPLSNNHSHKQLTPNITQPTPPLSSHTSHSATPMSNHCTVHSQQLIRHLCLDCIQLLCSQCISDHILIHKQNNSFPNIQTLKQLKVDMHTKLEQMINFMFKQKNHPKNMMNSVDVIRNESLQKIDNLKRELIQFIQQWIQRLKVSIVNNVGYQQIKLIQQQMYSIHDEVNQLINSLSSNNFSVHDVKKAYQIDADKLQKCYKEMLEKYNSLTDTMKVDIDLDGSKFIEGLQQAITLRIGSKNKHSQDKIIKLDDQDQQKFQQEYMNLPLQVHTKGQNTQKFDAVPFLYSLISGTDVLKIIAPDQHNNQIQSYQIQGVLSFPLNSVCLLPDGMVVVSGGMIAQNKKNDIVQMFDYQQRKLITQSKLNKGRSSHRTIVHEDKIFFIGGFNSQNQQCKYVQILTIDGIVVSPHKCKWGGPNLSVKYNGKILKITVSGIQLMNFDDYKWQQLSTDVPFALSKGMQIATYLEKQGRQSILIFGDDQYYYKWNLQQKIFLKFDSNITRPVISSTTKDNKVYGWVDDNKTAIIKFQNQKWITMPAKTF